MKCLRIAICALLLSLSPAGAFWHGSATLASLARSELSLSVPNAGEYPFVNLFKAAGPWSYGNNFNTKVKADELDSNGYPKFGGAWSSNNGAVVLFSSPSQAERPGHYVLTWTGAAKFFAAINGVNTTGISCTGTAGSAGGAPSCDNTACSSFTGSLAGTTLTVTVPPTGTGCTLGTGLPISGAGVKVTTFGTPTIITTAGSVCGGNTCYTVNQSQTVGSEAMNIGGRFEVVPTGGNDQTTTTAAWNINEQSTVNGNQASNFGFFHVGDESAYWASANPCGSGYGCIVSPIFKTRIQQANFAVLRDLDWNIGNNSNCTTWATRKPVNYYSYSIFELRNAASGPGQYVNASGTGASGGTVSYNAGTDTYSITLGAGGPVDKQTIIMLAPATGTTSSKISLNGTTATTILGAYGVPLAGSFGAFIPQLNGVTTLVYDAVLGGFLSFGGSTVGDVGLNCYVPPEVFIEINAELGTTPWHTPGVMSLDPMTDWVSQYATYVKATYTPPRSPIFEATNEPWNTAAGPYVCPYLSTKSAVYIAEDAAWGNGSRCGSSGNINSEVGKIASTMGQDLVSVYGAGAFELVIPVQTAWFGASQFSDVLQASAYINQTVAPTQAGYTKTAAYLYGTRISLAPYWNTGHYQDGPEVALAYCYYNYSISSPCQGLYASQAVVMAAKMDSSIVNFGTGVLNLPTYVTLFNQWLTWAATCSLGSRPGGCTLNQTSPLMMYEGSFQEFSTGSDATQTVASATNAATAVLAVTGNGCVAGQAVALSSLSGGTWSTAAGPYTVQASGTDANHCAINLNSAGLGTLSSATLTYTGSAPQLTYLRSSANLSPGMDTYVTALYNDVTANGGINPSQYHLATFSNFQNNPWYVFNYDIYGYFPQAQCTSCTIASSTLTLGGTITGVFAVGQTLFGAGVTGIGTGAGSNTTISSCTPVGANVCGTTSGDTLGLSQVSTVAVGTTMTGNIAPSTNNAGNSTTSPARGWGAICRWNNNGNQCNG